MGECPLGPGSSQVFSVYKFDYRRTFGGFSLKLCDMDRTYRLYASEHGNMRHILIIGQPLNVQQSVQVAVLLALFAVWRKCCLGCRK